MGSMLRFMCWTGVLLAQGCLASAENLPPPDINPAPQTHLLAAGTEVHLRLLQPVASNTHAHGDRFTLEVVEPINVDGVLLVPSGAQAIGEVVHAAKGGFGGRAGELILASRFISVGGQTIKLRSFSAGSGENRVNLAMGLSFVVVGIFVKGKDISLPAGTDVYAKVAEDSSLRAVAPPAETTQDNVVSASTTPLPHSDSLSTSTAHEPTSTEQATTEMKNNEDPQP